MSEHLSAPAGIGTPVPGTPDAVAPAGVPAEPTGDAAVDEALGRLAGIERDDLRAQLVTFEAVHGALQDRLADAEG